MNLLQVAAREAARHGVGPRRHAPGSVRSAHRPAAPRAHVIDPAELRDGLGACEQRVLRQTQVSAPHRGRAALPGMKCRPQSRRRQPWRCLRDVVHRCRRPSSERCRAPRADLRRTAPLISSCCPFPEDAGHADDLAGADLEADRVEVGAEGVESLRDSGSASPVSTAAPALRRALRKRAAARHRSSAATGLRCSPAAGRPRRSRCRRAAPCSVRTVHGFSSSLWLM